MTAHISARWILANFLFLFGVTVLPLEVFAVGSPILQLSTGANTGKLRTVFESQDGKYLVTGGDDRVIRWLDAGTLKQLNASRGEIGGQGYGSITSMALSPDNKWLAIGIFYPHDTQTGEVRSYLRIHDYQSGRLLRLLRGHKQVIHSLNFSSDGSLLISGEALQNDPVAIIWNTSSWSKKHVLKAHKNQIFGTNFTANNRLAITTGWDKTIKFWDVDSGKLLKSINAHKSRIYSMAVSSSKDAPIAVTGSIDKTVKIWDISEKKLIRTIKVRRGVRNVALSPNNQYVAVSMVGSDLNAVIETYELSTGKKLASYTGHDSTPSALAIGLDNQTVYSSGGYAHELHSWDLFTGQNNKRQFGVGSPLRSAGISNDGDIVYWGTEKQIHKGKIKLTHKIELANLHGQLGTPVVVNTPGSNIARAIHKQNGVSLHAEKGGTNNFSRGLLRIKRGWKTLGTIAREIETGHSHTAYTLTPDGKYVISGALVGRLELYDLSGNQIGKFEGHTGEITDLAVSSGGGLLVSSSRDQTVRLWNIATQELLISIFNATDGEWVVWASTGHYTSSPDGDKYIGWVVNQGVDQDANYVLADELKSKLFRPDIINSIIKNRSVSAGVSQAGTVGFAVGDISTKSYEIPAFSIVSPPGEMIINSKNLDITVLVENKIDKDITWNVTVNNRRVDFNKFGGSANKKVFSIPVYLGRNLIQLKATNRSGEKTHQLVVVRQGDGKSAEQPISGRLLLISVGVNEYKRFPESDWLEFAVADATEFESAMSIQNGKLFESIESIVLTDDSQFAPTKTNIEDALDRLSNIRRDDTVLLFMAGHGVLEGGEYFYLPQEAEYNQSGELVKSTVVSWEVIQSAIANSLGRRIMFVDTCFSAGAFNPRLVKDAEDASIIVFSATDSSTLAQEIAGLDHGVFTFSILEALKGEADSYQDGHIMMTELSDFVSDAVKNKTNDYQVPVLRVPGKLQDFTFFEL